MRIYTGIGSRETHEDILAFFEKVSIYLSQEEWILRSGGAPGADSAFEKGAKNKEIYLPWKGFNGNKSEFIVKDEAFEIAAKYHPRWNELSNGAKRLHARNVHQILGYDLKTPTAFVICWTKDGKGSGGTGQALRIAKDYNIPIFDVGAYETLDEFRIEFWKWLKKYQEENK